MTVRAYLDTLRRHALWLILLLIVGGIVGFSYSQTLPRLYRSYASLIVVPVQGNSTAEVVQGSNYVTGIVPSYSQLATTPYVLQPVIDELGLEESTTQLARQVTVQNLLDTVIIQISVTNQSPEEAQRIAGAINDSLIRAVSELSPSIDSQPAVAMESISPASLPPGFISPDWRVYTFGGAIAGLAIAVGIALLREQLRSHPRNVDELAELLDAGVLGDVPEISRNTASSLPAAILAEPDGPAAEALRGIAASMRFVSVGKESKVLMITSADAAEGKTSFATALALAIAESGQKTLLIDGDLRHSSVADIVGLEGAVGLTSVLLKEVSLTKAIQHWGNNKLAVLVGGDRAPNPGQLVSSGLLADIISEARAAFDVVIIDTPPVLPVSDALWIAPFTDGSIVVVRARKTPMKSVQKALASLSTTATPALGTVLNRTKESHRVSYYGDDAASHMPKRARRGWQR